MTKEDFIKFASQGNSRVSVNKIIEDFDKNPLQVYKILNNKNAFLFITTVKKKFQVKGK